MDNLIKHNDHLIILTGEDNKETGLHFGDFQNISRYTLENIQEIIRKYARFTSTHFISTENSTWKSVVEKDPYFWSVKLVEPEDNFISFEQIVKENAKIKSLDVEKYIIQYNLDNYKELIKVYDYRKIELLVSLSYWTYYEYYNSALFDDNISDYVLKNHDKEREAYSKYEHFLSKMKILNSNMGLEKIQIINKVIDENYDVPIRILNEIVMKEKQLVLQGD